MTKFIIKRILAMLPVLLLVTFLMFCLSAMSAGDPARVLAEKIYSHPTLEEVELVRHQEGLDRPFLQQYVSWLQNILHGDFGESYLTGKPAMQELLKHLPATLSLAATSLVLLLIIAVPLGILSGVYKDTVFDRIVQGFTFISVSLPNFWIGLMLLYLFGVKFRLISVIGGTSAIGIPIIAAFAFDIGYFGIVIRLLRTNLSDVLGKDFIRTERAKGMSGARVIFIHGLKNSVIPVMTRAVGILINMFCGSAVIESVFSINGIGEVALEAVVTQDIPLIQAFVLSLAIVVVIVNLLMDIFYSLIDRRIQLT